MSLKDEDDLNLPDAPDYIPEEPKYTWQQMIRLSESMLRYWNEKRFKEPVKEEVREEFILD